MSVPVRRAWSWVVVPVCRRLPVGSISVSAIGPKLIPVCAGLRVRGGVEERLHLRSIPVRCGAVADQRVVLVKGLRGGSPSLRRSIGVDALPVRSLIVYLNYLQGMPTSGRSGSTRFRLRLCRSGRCRGTSGRLPRTRLLAFPRPFSGSSFCALSVMFPHVGSPRLRRVDGSLTSEDFRCARYLPARGVGLHA